MRRRFERVLGLNRRKATAACPTSLGGSTKTAFPVWAGFE